MTSIVDSKTSKSSEVSKGKPKSVSSIKSIPEDDNFLDKLNEYYRLKHKYDTKVQDKKKAY